MKLVTGVPTPTGVADLITSVQLRRFEASCLARSQSPTPANFPSFLRIGHVQLPPEIAGRQGAPVNERVARRMKKK